MKTRREVIWKFGPMLFGLPLSLVLFLEQWFGWYGWEPSRLMSLEFWVLFALSVAMGYWVGALFGWGLCAVIRCPSEGSR
jgi:hypothetical protein